MANRRLPGYCGLGHSVDALVGATSEPVELDYVVSSRTVLARLASLFGNKPVAILTKDAVRDSWSD